MSKISVKFQNAVYANYLIRTSKALGDISDEYSYLIEGALPDLKMTRLHTDLGLLQDKALITVNGIIHSTVYNGEDFWIVDGAKSMVKSVTSHVGIVSFMAYSNNLIKYPMSRFMITEDPSMDLHDKLFITAPASVSTIALVVGGFLQLEEPGVLYRVSDSSFALCLKKVNYLKKLYELNNYTDIFSQLGLVVTPGDGPVIDEALAVSNEYIKRFMTLKTSFIVSVPTDNLIKEKFYLSQNTRPGYFDSFDEPKDCLFSHSGKILEYFKEKMVRGWESAVLDWRYENYLLSSMSQNKIDIINGTLVPTKENRLAGAYLLNLSSNV